MIRSLSFPFSQSKCKVPLIPKSFYFARSFHLQKIEEKHQKSEENTNKSKKNSFSSNNKFGWDSGAVVAPVILLSAGVFSLMSEDNDTLESKDPYPTKIETLMDAVNWVQYYHENKDPQLFPAAILRLVEAVVNAPEPDRTHLYLRLVGFMSEVFSQNPHQLKEWHWDLTLRTPDKNFIPYLWYAASLSGVPEGDEILLTIIQRRMPGASEEAKMKSVQHFQKTVIRQTFAFPGHLISVLIGKFHASGNQNYVEEIVRVYQWAYKLIRDEFPFLKLGDILQELDENEVELVERANKDFIEIARDPLGFDALHKMWVLETNELLKEAIGISLFSVSGGKAL